MASVYGNIRARIPDPSHRESHESGKAVIVTDYDLPDSLQKRIDDLLAGYHDHAKLFFTHLLLSARGEDEWWVPVPANTIRKDTYGAYDERARMEKAGLLEWDKTAATWRCYEYRIPENIRRELIELYATGLIDEDVSEFQTSGRPKHKTRLYDDNDHRFKEPLYSALKALQKGRFDRRGIEQHLKREQKEMRRVIDEDFEADELIGQDPKAREKHLHLLDRRFLNDLRCYNAVKNQAPTLIGDPTNALYEYALAYSVTSTGRISQMGGGLQNCSREMKAAAYGGLDDVYNYDIRSSQAYILKGMMDEGGFDSAWLKTYLAVDKEEYAQQVGISVDTWKECMYALLFGAILSLSDNHLGESLSIKTILVDGERKARLQSGVAPTESMRSAVERQFESLKKVVTPLYHEIRKWRAYLDKNWLGKRKHHHKSGWSVRNDAGVVLRQSDYEAWPTTRRRAKLASFVLQGKEAAFIHTLTAKLLSHGVIPISNEHDGIVTVGQIPSTAIDEVKRELGMAYVELVEKPFN